MSVRVWGWLASGAVAIAAGAYFLSKDEWHASVPYLGGFAILLGIALIACAVFTRRTRLVADAEGFTYKNWRGSRSIPWRRLSSIQVKSETGTLVVVNDMGRCEMTIPLHLFERSQLLAWLDAIPARTPGAERLVA